MDRSADVAVVGAGIAGLAHAYMALRKGYRVVLFERDQFAVGASVRNFGLVWPIGQEPGDALDCSLRARQHWFDVAEQAGFWLHRNGSLHLAYHEDEWAVLEEFVSAYKESPYQCSLLSPQQVLEKSPVARGHGLIGGLWSETEGTVYSREAVRRIADWLVEKYGLIIRYGNTVTEVSVPHIMTARETWQVDHVFICSGADFETLYPEIFDEQPITKCRLQMLKATAAKPVSIGPTLCGGLTLRHYAAFNKCQSLKKVDQRYDEINIDYKKHGVHVLVAQNHLGELIIGDSHHYGKTHEPFDSEYVNQIILNYLDSFTDLGTLQVTERWHGTYPKLQNGATHLVVRPEPNVTIVNGLGGAGMTLGFGIAESIVNDL
jgi:FAD dependent oxidoreductase TIGR03364